MGAHKGKKWADKGSKKKYFAEGHRRANKMRRIRKCNGEAYLAWWVATYPA